MAQHVEGHKVFVGDLPGDVTQEEVQTVFATYGELTNLVLMNPSSKSYQRCALVFYKDASSAEDAIKVLNGVYKIREDAPTPIKVAWAKERGGAGGGGGAAEIAQDPDGFKMFIGGLPLDIKEEELKVVFSTYGEVNKLHLMQPKEGATRAAAFIYYSNQQSGEDAISVLHEQYKIRPDAEAPISVKWAINKDKGCGKGGQGDWNSWSGDWGSSWGGGGAGAAGGKCQTVDGWKLFVGGLPQGVTEEELSAVFTTYGTVKKIHVMPPHATNTKMAAFVFYDSDTSAEDAIKVLNGVYKIREDMDVPIQVKWGQDKSAMKGACVGGGKGSGGGWGGGGGWNGGGGGGWDNGSWGKGGGGGYGGGGKGYGGGYNGGGGGYGGGGSNYVGGGGGGSWKGGGGGGGYGGGGYGAASGGGGGWSDGGSWGKSGGKGQGKELSETKLFVGNLPPDVTEDAVKYVFQTYGTINNVHLMVGKSRSGAACAFVEFAQPTEAETAILTLNDKYEIKPGFGPIMVKKAGAQRKGPY